MKREVYEGLVEAAVADLPETFRDRLDNVSFYVEDRAEPSDYRRHGTSGQGLVLGVYRAVPVTQHTSGYRL